MKPRKIGEIMKELLEEQALELGYQLQPLPRTILETLFDIEAGRNTARAIADVRGLALNAAGNRLRRTEALGLIECSLDGWALTGAVDLDAVRADRKGE